MAITTHIFDTIMRPVDAAGMRRMRRRTVSRAFGRVLEVGAGSGLNASHYNFRLTDSLNVTDLIADKPVLRAALRRADAPHDRITVEDADLCDLPYEDASFDSIVCTLVLCSVGSLTRAIDEMWRVLRPYGIVCFIEHVHSSRPVVRPALESVTPAWRRVAGGCHLNRDTLPALRRHGFSVQIEQTAVDNIVNSGYATRL